MDRTRIRKLFLLKKKLIFPCLLVNLKFVQGKIQNVLFFLYGKIKIKKWKMDFGGVEEEG